MSEERRYFVYIMANASRRLYTGMTNSLRRRVREHKLKPGFAAKYNITRLVYFESFGDVRNAIQREKQIKAWTRAKGLRWLSRRIPNGMICRASGISRRLSEDRVNISNPDAPRAETRAPRFARDDNRWDALSTIAISLPPA